MVLAVPPVILLPRQGKNWFGTRPSPHGQDDVLGLDNGAHTVDAYWCLPGGKHVRAETPGSIPPLLVGRRALTSPRLSGAPPGGVLLPFDVDLYASSRGIEATLGADDMSTEERVWREVQGSPTGAAGSRYSPSSGLITA